MIRRWHRFQARTWEMLDWEGKIDGWDMAFLIGTHLVGIVLGFVSGSAIALVCASLIYLLIVFGTKWANYYQELEARPKEALHGAAIHEAGHALVGHAIGGRVRYANIARVRGRVGAVSTAINDKVQTPPFVLLLNLSGLVAEQIVFGSCDPNSAEGDLKKALLRIRATALLTQTDDKLRVFEQEMGANPMLVRFDKDLPIERFFPGEKFSDTEKVIFQFSWKLTQSFILQHEEQLRLFAADLVDHRTLPETTIAAHFAKVPRLTIPKAPGEISRIFKEPFHARRPEPSVSERARGAESA